MKQGIIRKRDVAEILSSVRQDRKVFAPIGDRDDVSLSELLRDQEPALDYSNFKLSPKNLFLPQCEVICTYENEELHDVPMPEDKRLVFGIRPCDARALTCLDKVFGEFGGFKDPYYVRRRENAVIISMACSTPCDTCFCASVGGDPAGEIGCDILAFDVQDYLLFEAKTAKGEAFMGEFSRFFSKVGELDLRARDEVIRVSHEKIRVIDFGGLKGRLECAFDSPVWNSVSRVCLGCGLCTYQCPTCSCFDITDEKKGRSGRRIRTWDSCQYPLFTLHASGHNPRPSRKERMRQRILHKFLYTVDTFGQVFCVGCGRCVRNCPVNLDLRETLEILIKTI